MRTTEATGLIAMLGSAARRLWESPEGVFVREQHDAEELAKRREWADDSRAAREQAEREVTTLLKKQDAAADAVERTRKALDAESLAYRAAAGAVSEARWRYSRRIDQNEARLRETAPPQIADFIAELSELQTETFKTKWGGYDRVLTNRGAMLRRVGNSAAINAKCEAIRAAITRTRELWREALSESDLLGRFDAERDGLQAEFRLIDHEAAEREEQSA